MFMFQVAIVECLNKLFFLSDAQGLCCANVAQNRYKVDDESVLVVPGAFTTFS
jgi:hypothetical protein